MPSLADLWTTQSPSALTASWRGPAQQTVIHDALLGRPRTLEVDDPWSRERYPLMQFIREAWHVIEPREFVEGWHIEAVVLHLEAIARGDIKRLLLNIPMRSGKSVVQAVLFPAWMWITDPAHKFLCTSYSKDLALRDSVRCRQLIMSKWYRERWGDRFRLYGDVNVKSRYANDKGGYRITSAVGGATGDGGDTLICDDLHSRNEDDSPSRADIKAAVDFFNGDFAGCLTDPIHSAIIVSGQRIAVDDISADVLQRGGYCHLKIRQEYVPPAPDKEEPVTTIGWHDPRTQLGELMWPTRWGPAQVAEAKRRGMRKYLAHHQQDPEGSGGNLFNDEWWQVFVQWPALESFRKIVQSWDMRFKDDKEQGSFVVGQVWGLAPNATNVFLLDEVRGRWDFNETKEAFVALCQKWPLARIKLVENKANGPAIYSGLRAKTFGITLVDVDGGKFARSEKHTETVKSGQVWIPADTLVPWIADWRNEARIYPSEPNDRMDAATQAWDYLLPRTLADDPRTEERERQRRRRELVKRVYRQQKITASRTGA